MIEYENECVQCGLPCLSSCRHRRAPHYYCDECGAEETLYIFEGKELCGDCVLLKLQKAEG